MYISLGSYKCYIGFVWYSEGMVELPVLQSEKDEEEEAELAAEEPNQT